MDDVERARACAEEVAQSLDKLCHCDDASAALLCIHEEERVAALIQRHLEEHVGEARVPCKGCGGKDTAQASEARCYNCRNRPLWDADAARALADRLGTALKEAVDAWASVGMDESDESAAGEAITEWKAALAAWKEAQR